MSIFLFVGFSLVIFFQGCDHHPTPMIKEDEKGFKTYINENTQKETSTNTALINIAL